MRFRKGIVFACITVSMLLGALYYATATRLYESSAGILVMQTGSDISSTRITPEGARQGLMPTYERILQSSEVLEEAACKLPREYRIDLHNIPQAKWAQAIRKNLNVKTDRNTNVINVVYRSHSPEAAAAVVQSIVDSYLLFMQKTNDGAAMEILRVLNQEKAAAEQKLYEKQQQVLQARQQILDLGSGKENGPIHPVVKQALAFNDTLIEIRGRREALLASLGAIRATVRNGGDLSQHMLALEGEIGRELLMASLGISSQDATSRIKLEQQLLEDQAQLDTYRNVYGENHPKVRTILNRMQVTRHYMESHKDRIQAQLAKMQTEQLGPMLIKIVEQRLAEIIRHENGILASFNQARDEAIEIIGSTRQLEILEADEQYLRRECEGLLDKVAQIGLTQDQGNIRTAVTDPPKIIPSHVWPKLPLVGLFSLVIGIAASIGVVSVLDALDDRFRSPEEMQEQLNLPVLAIVRKLHMEAESGMEALQMYVAPDAPESEAFRTLRTAIALRSQDVGRIVVSSTEPGDGKTTILSNLAIANVRAGKRVLLIDADMRRPGLTKLLNLRGQPGLTQVLQGNSPMNELVEHYVLPSGVERL
ncbi:MAG: hypothetical protein JW829_18990, partial [Pirellulales bacterium]|nr:hypothetical protein [Pirellulales bacterium]